MPRTTRQRARRRPTRAQRRGHPHPRRRPEQVGRQRQRHGLPDHRVGSGDRFGGSRLKRRSADMHGLFHRPGYRLYAPNSPEAEAVLAEVGVTRADLDRALAELERSEGIRVRSIAGINDDGVFGVTREDWHPDLPDACKEPFVPLLWIRVLELLGRAPSGSTARFLEDGTLPD